MGRIGSEKNVFRSTLLVERESDMLHISISHNFDNSNRLLDLKNIVIITTPVQNPHCCVGGDGAVRLFWTTVTLIITRKQKAHKIRLVAVL